MAVNSIVTPFQLFATLVFACALIHAFLTPTIGRIAEKVGHKKDRRKRTWKWHHFQQEVLILLSEVEVVFGIWLIPLFIGFVFFRSAGEALAYVNAIDYTHPLYITVIVVVIASRPIITFAECVLERFARLFGDRAEAWWWTLLTLGPILGALLKEPGAMALSAILLGRKFYRFKPGKVFAYATLGLLFTNISVGGTLTSFASRSLFIVAAKWDWGPLYMFTHFGWKALVGIAVANFCYFVFFKKEFQKHFPKKIPTLEKGEDEQPTPMWITVVHLIFLALIAISGEYAPLFLGLFLLFLGFHTATKFHQKPLNIKPALLVGFFFASLLIHGELQRWWMLEFLERSHPSLILLKTLSLSAFVDNAIVIYIASTIADQSDLFHYFVIAGAMSAGGLTVVANAPNPIGHSVLRPHFGGSISFGALFLAALFPASLMCLSFWVFR